MKKRWKFLIGFLVFAAFVNIFADDKDSEEVADKKEDTEQVQEAKAKEEEKERRAKERKERRAKEKKERKEKAEQDKNGREEKARKEEDKKRKKEKEKKEKEEKKEKWDDLRSRMLEHYSDSGLINIKTDEYYTVFYAYVPDEFKLSTEQEKQYYVEKLGPFLEQDLNANFKGSAHVYFKYEDGTDMATRKMMGGWKIK